VLEHTIIIPGIRQYFPLADPPPVGYERSTTHAVATGERRPPRAGEWFLSGALIEAYQAAHDLNQVFHIARLVRTETVTRKVILEV
jgi:hypothetical protein